MGHPQKVTLFSTMFQSFRPSFPGCSNHFIIFSYLCPTCSQFFPADFFSIFQLFSRFLPISQEFPKFFPEDFHNFSPKGHPIFVVAQGGSWKRRQVSWPKSLGIGARPGQFTEAWGGDMTIENPDIHGNMMDIIWN